MPKDALDTYINDGKIRFTGVGTNIPTRLDTELDIEGRWVTDKRYGKQLSIKSHAEILPQTIDGIIGYLSSSLFKGIGPKTAELIVVNFGLKTLDVLEREPDLLLQVKGITPEKLIHITESFKDTRSVQQLVSYLTP